MPFMPLAGRVIVVSNYKLVRKHHIYTRAEISRLFDVHPRTISAWIKAGLIPLNPGGNPLYFQGVVLKEFLKSRQERHRISLKKDEMLCLKCRAGVLPVSGSLKIVNTGRRLGNGHWSILFQGICPLCGSKINRLGSQASDEEDK